jgi:hypothetical protein
MKNVILFILIIFNGICFSQQTESYLNFANDFKISNSIKVETKWKNGKTKEIKNSIKLSYKNTNFERLKGTYLQFNKKGIKRTESLFDKYGNFLIYKLFDLEGNVIKENITLIIDYTKNGLVEITKFEKNFIKTEKDVYLYRKGKTLNDKKIGKWLTFDCDGKIIKEKNYSK